MKSGACKATVLYPKYDIVHVTLIHDNSVSNATQWIQWMSCLFDNFVTMTSIVFNGHNSLNGTAVARSFKTLWVD